MVRRSDSCWVFVSESKTRRGRRPIVLCAGLEQGIHPRVVQERLGHSTIAISLGISSHVDPTLHDEAAEIVAGLVLSAQR